jgi:hypothetical protein
VEPRRERAVTVLAVEGKAVVLLSVVRGPLLELSLTLHSSAFFENLVMTPSGPDIRGSEQRTTDKQRSVHHA